MSIETTPMVAYDLVHLAIEERDHYELVAGLVRILHDHRGDVGMFREEESELCRELAIVLLDPNPAVAGSQVAEFDDGSTVEVRFV